MNTGTCIYNSSSACCGNGKCLYDNSTRKTVCQCKIEFAGTFCDVEAAQFESSQEIVKLLTNRLFDTAITDKNVATVVSTLNKIVGSGTLDSSSLKNAKDILAKSV